MREEMNHLIEYFTVLKKSAEMIFGDEVKKEARLSLGINATDKPEEFLLRERL